MRTRERAAATTTRRHHRAHPQRASGRFGHGHGLKEHRLDRRAVTEQRADGPAPTRQGGFNILGRLPVHGGMTAVMTVAITVTIAVTTAVAIAVQGGFNILDRLPVHGVMTLIRVNSS